mmetsp:Transcript_18044/g.50484  ORF Transcript_18044/g.50484 Transcript_18044/m.50484 type:complete len:293 (+) Transcript_18044:725-1603(+)
MRLHSLVHMTAAHPRRSRACRASLRGQRQAIGGVAQRVGASEAACAAGPHGGAHGGAHRAGRVQLVGAGAQAVVEVAARQLRGSGVLALVGALGLAELPVCVKVEFYGVGHPLRLGQISTEGRLEAGHAASLEGQGLAVLADVHLLQLLLSLLLSQRCCLGLLLPELLLSDCGLVSFQLLALCLRQPAPARGVQHRLVQLDPFLTGEAELLTLGDGWGGAGLGRGGLLQHFPIQLLGTEFALLLSLPLLFSLPLLCPLAVLFVLLQACQLEGLEDVLGALGGGVHAHTLDGA